MPWKYLGGNGREGCESGSNHVMDKVGKGEAVMMSLERPACLLEIKTRPGHCPIQKSLLAFQHTEFFTRTN